MERNRNSERKGEMTGLSGIGPSGVNLRIGINAVSAHKRTTGLGVYTREVSRGILKKHDNTVVYTLSDEIKKSWQQKTRLVTPIISPNLGTVGHGLRQIWYQSVLPLRLSMDKIDVLYSTVQEGILRPSVSQVITIHDMVSFKFPEFYPKLKYYDRFILPRLLRSCKAVICVSESTKQDVLDNFDLKGIPIHTVYGGIDRKRYYPRDGRNVYRKYALEDFILYVGDIKPHKNLGRAVEAFNKLRPKGMKFVCAGQKTQRFFPQIKNLVKELKLEDKMVFLDYVPEEDLPYLYSGARAFIFPSLHEGFGLPPLEAMASGTPVVVSNTTSLPEVCGDAACYVDPYDVESIAEGIHKILSNKDFRDNLAKKGLERARVFSWETTASKILDILKEVARV
jgi:glycosyltransferase involved in cell wall biosynthesis